MEFSFSNNRWLSLEEINADKTINNRNALGFHIPGMWDKILDLNNCCKRIHQIQFEIVLKLCYQTTHHFLIKTTKGVLRALMIRTTSSEEIMVVVQFFGNKIANKDHYGFSQIFISEITSLQYVINQRQ